MLLKDAFEKSDFSREQGRGKLPGGKEYPGPGRLKGMQSKYRWTFQSTEKKGGFALILDASFSDNLKLKILSKYSGTRTKASKMRLAKKYRQLTN